MLGKFKPACYSKHNREAQHPFKNKIKSYFSSKFASRLQMALPMPEQVPVDGIMVRGAAHVSNQHITGEALPILAQQGTELLAGALATDSWLVLRATRVARESALARIAELTEFAKVGKPLNTE